jgi:hypothetical protein
MRVSDSNAGTLNNPDLDLGLKQPPLFRDKKHCSQRAANYGQARLRSQLEQSFHLMSLRDKAGRSAIK